MKDEKKLVHNIMQIFRKKDRFTGRMEEHIHDYLDNFEEAFSNYNISAKQMHCYMHNIFDAESKQFYKNYILSCAAYDDTRALLISKYSNIKKQNRIRRLF